MRISLKTAQRMGYEPDKRLIIDYGNTRITETVGGKLCHFRSLLECNWAYVLQWMKETKQIKDWAFEQTTFTFEKEIRGVKQFLVDFDVLNNDGTFEYHETKGWLRGVDVTKFQRVVKYKPGVKIRLVMSGRKKKDANRLRQIEKYADRIVFAPDFFKQLEGLIRFKTKDDVCLENHNVE
jgi:hypothetical protein